jgi:hypothetical protein
VSCVGKFHSEVIFCSGETVLEVVGHFVFYQYNIKISLGLVLLCQEFLCVENECISIMDLTGIAFFMIILILYVSYIYLNKGKVMHEATSLNILFGFGKLFLFIRLHMYFEIDDWV